MSEPAAPYSPRRPLRFRVWDGKRMHYPREGADPSPLLVLHLDGVVEECTYDDDGTPYVLRTRRDCAVMPSTGLTDSEGREVYEGDRLSDGCTPFTVAWEPRRAGFCVEVGGGRWPLTAEWVGRLRVVGHAYDGWAAEKVVAVCDDAHDGEAPA